MKTLVFVLVLIISACSPQNQRNTLYEEDSPIQMEKEDSPMLAFPGAEGFGAYAIGGRGGKVYHVTHLYDDGEGSLRWAIEQKGPRTIVFDVSGYITLESQLTIKEPYLTIAGQTAPGDGITLRGETLRIEADHVIIRFIRSRLGNGKYGQGSVQGKDALSISKGENIIVDHCSTSWSLDEVLSTSTSKPYLDKVTVQWCYITEGLNPGGHGFGALIRGTGGAKYSYLYNLFAHNHGRNPRPGNYDSNPYTEDPDGLLLDFRNNVIYNWGGKHAGYNADKESVTKFNYVNNYLIPGMNSVNNGIAYSAGSVHNKAYFAGNWYDGRYFENQWDLVKFKSDRTPSQLASYKQSVPFESGQVSPISAEDSYTMILNAGGTFIPSRDAVDLRIIADVEHRKGKIIASQEEVGGWPALRYGLSPIDNDGDGIPDNWEIEHTLNPKDPADGNTKDKLGYTMLEHYLNGLVAERIK